jgi:predicted N-formylglutamate amidohydrolase
MSVQLFLSCEHGGNQLPDLYQRLFASAANVLSTHRAIDIGALELFHLFEKAMHPHFSISSEVCRLIVDLNRSLHRRTLFSEFTKSLSKPEKEQILNEYYFPYRQAFIDALQKSIDQKQKVLHVSVHSFTPVLHGIERQTDIGILYHPARIWEKAFAASWKVEMNQRLPGLRVRFNYPYLGKPDGHVAYHRKEYTNHQYAGIELEMNQKYAFNQDIYQGIVESFKAAWATVETLVD